MFKLSRHGIIKCSKKSSSSLSSSSNRSPMSASAVIRFVALSCLIQITFAQQLAEVAASFSSPLTALDQEENALLNEDAGYGLQQAEEEGKWK